MLPLARELAKLMTWTLGLFWELGSVFHVNVPALITGLGIGGVAIALAGKETVENFFAAFTILSDKPFQTGDSIRVGDTEGVVERIGFRSTRLRNKDGSEYIIPNQTLVNQNLVNLSSRKTREMKLTAHIRYGISAETLQVLSLAIKENLLRSGMVNNPVSVLLESMEKETMQLLISWHFAHPLPDGADLATMRHKVHLIVFETISQYAKQGVQIAE
jgi:MscS family membrane protein